MIAALATAAFTYAALALAAREAGRLGWALERCRGALRGAWCAGWLAGCVELLVQLRADPRAPIDLSLALAVAASSLAAALARAGRGPERARAIAWAARGGLLCLVAVIAAAAPLDGWLVLRALACPAAQALGEGVAWALDSGRALLFRLLAYWSSFVGTWALLVPLCLRPLFPAAPRPLPLPALGLLAPALLLAALATREFARAGGTPEPNDAPPRLATGGIYRLLRNPIQLAEILFVWSGALCFESAASPIYALCFSLILVLPVRLREERQLAARFGPEWLEHRRRVPAFLPRWRRAELRLAERA